MRLRTAPGLKNLDGPLQIRRQGRGEGTTLGEKNWSGIVGPAVAWSLLLLLAEAGGGARARTGG